MIADVNKQASLFDVSSRAGPPPTDKDAKIAGSNYRLDLGAYLVPENGVVARALWNAWALRTLYDVEAAGRPATEEEKQTLSSYLAYGGISQVLDPRHSEWRSEYNHLAKLLSPDDLKSIQESTPYAFFTPPRLVRAMWDGLARLGFQGGHVLEPSMGTGLFFGAMPADLAAHSTLTGVEIDQVSGRIARLLYPRADIHLCGLQETDFAEGSFDVVIGNVPFGQVPAYDPLFSGKKTKFLLQSIHNYFMAKSLWLVRPGGLVALIVSRYFLDAEDDRVRRYLACRATLLGAFRLPSNTFEEIARTEVTADLLVFQRCDEGREHSFDDAPWAETVEATFADKKGINYPARINRLYNESPEWMLGVPQITSSQYGPKFELAPGGKTVWRSLSEAMRQALPEDVYEGAAPACPSCGGPVEPGAIECRSCVLKQHGMVTAHDGVADGAYFISDVDGRLYQNDGGVGKLVRGSRRALERIAGMLQIRDLARSLLNKNLEDCPDDELKPLQQKLMWQYHLFVARHGFLNNNANRSAFKEDPDAPFVWALELYDEEKGVGKPASIFFRRTIGKAVLPDRVESARDALSLSLNLYGRINWDYMEQVTSRRLAELNEELEGEVFMTPGGQWRPASEYLSGDVRRKLAEARQAAKDDPVFRVNVQALEKVLPDDLLPDEIIANLGAGWLPPGVVQQFLNELLIEESLANNLDTPGHHYVYEEPRYGIAVRYVESLAQWVVGGYYHSHSVLNTKVWGTDRKGAIDLAELVLSGQVVTIWDNEFDGENEIRVLNHEETVAAREKQHQIKEAFRKWVWLDASRREALARIYNETFNSTVPRAFDGRHLTLPGLGVDMPPLRPHQKDSIWRIMQGENALLWQIVGSGKTFVMLGGGMEMRRLGLRKKIMHVVPNHLLEQYATMFYRMYPAASLLLVNSKGLSKYRRAETLARIATGDWDAIIATHAAFGRIPVSDDLFDDFIYRQIEVLEDYLYDLDKSDPDEAMTFKQIQAQKDRFEAKLEERKAKVKRAQDKLGLTWEQLGIDLLFVDEAHEYKNLWFPTKMTRMPGLGGSESGRAMDMFLKTQYMTRRCVCGRLLGLQRECDCARSRRVGGTSVVFATGTALANSVAEIYTMQRYLQYDQLLEMGMGHFDAWAAQFGDTVTMLEMKPSGSGWRQNTRFARFNNVPELLRVFGQVADMQADSDKLGILRPRLAGAKPLGVEAQPSADFKAYMGQLAKRADELKDKKPWQDNILKIMGDASKAAAHMWLIDGGLPDDPDNKINLCAQNVYRIWRETTGVELPALPGQKVNLTQIVFLDLSTPKAEFNLYDYLKTKLVTLGIPAGQIAFIHDAKNDADRLKLFERMNEGILRVLIGSTTKMGTGANMQRLLKAEHDVDAPWRPADVEQRVGRIQRQGNLNEEIEVYRYITSGSLDFYKWHLLELKARFIRQIMEGSVSQRSIEDIDAVVISFAEMKALSTGDKLIIEQVEVQAQLTRLYALLNQYQTQRRRMKNDLSALPARVDHLERTIALYEHSLRKVKAAETGGFAMRVRGFTYIERKVAGAEFTDLVNDLDPFEKQEGVAELYGFPIHLERYAKACFALIELAPGATPLKAEMGETALGNVARLTNALHGLVERQDTAQQELGRLNRQIPQMEERLRLPFEHEAEMKRLEKRLAEIEEEIENRYKAEREGEKEQRVKGKVAALVSQAETSAVSGQVEKYMDAAEGDAQATPAGRRRTPMQKSIEDLLQGYGLLEAFRTSEGFHLRLSKDNYMPLVIERMGAFASVAHYYTQNGDAVADPDILYRLDDWAPVEITQPMMLIGDREVGGYQRIILEDGRFYPERLKSVNELSGMWAKNIRAQGWDEATPESLTHPDLVKQNGR